MIATENAACFGDTFSLFDFAVAAAMSAVLIRHKKHPLIIDWCS
jgi:hypothetical protein